MYSNKTTKYFSYISLIRDFSTNNYRELIVPSYEIEKKTYISQIIFRKKLLGYLSNDI